MTDTKQATDDLDSIHTDIANLRVQIEVMSDTFMGFAPNKEEVSERLETLLIVARECVADLERPTGK